MAPLKLNLNYLVAFACSSRIGRVRYAYVSTVGMVFVTQRTETKPEFEVHIKFNILHSSVLERSRI